MKIVSQTKDELVLKEGNASGVAMGVVFALVGLGAGYYQHFVVSTVFWIAAAFFLIGLAIIFFSSSITVEINKASGRLAYQTKRLIGGKNMDFAIADILRVETRKQWRSENTNSGNQGVSMPRQVLVSQSVIIFKDGRELPLDHQKNFSNMSIGPAVLMGGSGTEVAIAKQVADFLGVPFQEVAPPNSGTGINIGGIQL